MQSVPFMCHCSSRGRFLDVNQALVTMLGYVSRDELLEANHSIDILCSPSERAQLSGTLEIDWKRRNGATGHPDGMRSPK
jgi:PAS domain-containing protein